MNIRDVYVCMLVLCKAACGNTTYAHQYGMAFVKVATEMCDTEKVVGYQQRCTGRLVEYSGLPIRLPPRVAMHLRAILNKVTIIPPFRAI